MWQGVKRTVRELAKDSPGRRFRHYYARRQAGRAEHPVAWGLYVTLGVLVVATGLLLSIPPGVPGFLVTLAGLGILVVRLPAMGRALDRLELLVRRILPRARHQADGRGDRR